jgi:hypothetical protein
MKTLFSFLSLSIFALTSVFAQDTRPINPAQVITVEGVIHEKSNPKMAIPFAILTLFKLEEDGNLTKIAETNADKEGKYLFSLKIEQHYKILAYAADCMPNEFSVSTFGLDRTRGGYRFIRDFGLEVESPCTDVPYFRNIYFEWGEYSIREREEQKFEKVVSVLKKNPDFKLEIKGHIGLKEPLGGNENQPLSKLRAEKVKDYLISKGIEEARLKVSWFENQKPRYKKEQNVMEAANNQRVVFEVIVPNNRGRVRKNGLILNLQTQN